MDTVNTQTRRTCTSQGKPGTFHSIFKYMYRHLKGSFKWFGLSGMRKKSTWIIMTQRWYSLTVFLRVALESLLFMQTISFYLSIVLLHQWLPQGWRSCPSWRAVLCPSSWLTRPICWAGFSFLPESLILPPAFLEWHYRVESCAFWVTLAPQSPHL